MWRFLVPLVILGLGAGQGQAHFTILLPQEYAAKKGDKVIFIYQIGHPFEHELADAPQPLKVETVTPTGKKLDLGKTLEKMEQAGADGKNVNAYRFSFTPEERGDHHILLQTPPIFQAERQEFVQDTVRVFLHVQTQNGWETDPERTAFRILPLTRPYGLRAGMVFQAQVILSSPANRPVPLAWSVVEIERFNPTRPKEIPPDELVTFRAKTDLNGVVTCTLPEPGWWCLAAQRSAGTHNHEGKDYPLTERVLLWVHVQGKE